MVWCTCPVRCKGGREVAERTYSRHRKELRDQEHDRLVQRHLPENFPLLPNTPGRKHRTDGDEIHETCSKRARGEHGQEGRAVTWSVGVFVNFMFELAGINFMRARLLRMIDSKLQECRAMVDKVGMPHLDVCIIF